MISRTFGTEMPADIEHNIENRGNFLDFREFADEAQ